MIDPFNLPIPYSEHGDMQEFALFAIGVQGKNAKKTYPKVNMIIDELRVMTNELKVFDAINKLSEEELVKVLQKGKLGNYGRQVQTWKEVAKIDGEFTIERLEAIKGIGGKTARFIVGYGYGAAVGILDVHVLRWLGTKYDKVPKGSPCKGKKYDYWEKILLKEAEVMGIHPMKLDENIWKSGALKTNESIERSI